MHENNFTQDKNQVRTHNRETSIYKLHYPRVVQKEIIKKKGSFTTNVINN